MSAVRRARKVAHGNAVGSSWESDQSTGGAAQIAEKAF